jgi:hypothetical protein
MAQDMASSSHRLLIGIFPIFSGRMAFDHHIQKLPWCPLSLFRQQTYERPFLHCLPGRCLLDWQRYAGAISDDCFGVPFYSCVLIVAKNAKERRKGKERDIREYFQVKRVMT